MEKTTNGLETKTNKYKVPAVDTAFRILTLLSRKKYYESNLSEIAKALSLSPTTCYRILQQLNELSIVRYNQKLKQYSLGPYMVVLGERAKENLFDISYILPYLETLSEQTGFTCVLVKRIGKNRTTITGKAEGNDFGVNVSVGRHFFVADGAYGKCFLSYMEKTAVDEVLNMDKGLQSLTEQEKEELK